MSLYLVLPVNIGMASLNCDVILAVIVTSYLYCVTWDNRRKDAGCCQQFYAVVHCHCGKLFLITTKGGLIVCRKK